MYQKTDVMILLHFRLYKGKKTPLLRKHSICSDPQRCCFIFFFYSLVTITCSIILPQEDTSPLSTTVTKYCSSFLFSLLRFTFLPGRGSSQPAQSILEMLVVSSGGFSVLLRSRCAEAVLP